MRFFRFYVILQVLRGFVSKFCPEDRSLLSTRPLEEFTCFRSSRPRVVPISPNGEILLRRYTRRDGTRSFAHDMV